MSRLNVQLTQHSTFSHQHCRMVYKSDALILRTYKLGEADRIVVFLTRDRGKKRGVAKGARRPQVALHGGARAADARRGGVLRARAARAGAAQLRRRRAVAAAGAVGRGARARRVLRRADRRVGAGGARRRAVVPARRVDGRRDCRRARRSSSWRAISSTGCCGCRASIRRWRAPGASATLMRRGGDAAARAPVRLPPVRAVGRRDRPVGDGDAVSGRRRVGGAGEARTVAVVGGGVA